MAFVRHAQAAHVISINGDFPGGTYTIDYRDNNAILSVLLGANDEIIVQPRSMLMRDQTVTLNEKSKFSFKKMLTGAQMSQSVYTGPGTIVLAPAISGNIIAIHLDGSATWTVVRGEFLAMSKDVEQEAKSQSFSEAFFSSEDLRIQEFKGQGVVFVASHGAIIHRELAAGEELIVGTGHLVACTAKYKMERASGVLSQGRDSGEGLVCRFTDPGHIYVQTRSPDAVTEWIADQLHDNK